MMLTLGSFSSPAACKHRDLLDDVDLAALQRQDLRLVVVVEADLDPVRQRRRAPVVGVAHEGRADLRRELLQLERAGADHRRLEILGEFGRAG